MLLVCDGIWSNGLFAQDWIEYQMSNLSIDQKIGQLLIREVTVSDRQSELKKLSKLASKKKLGGVLFHGRDLQKHALWSNSIQASAGTLPLYVGVTYEEYFQELNLPFLSSFPEPMVLSATQDTALIRQTAQLFAKNLKAIGANMLFDINVNLSTRTGYDLDNSSSFGSQPYEVGVVAKAMIRGLKRKGVFPIIGSFPKRLPSNGEDVFYDRLEDLNQSDFVPFRKLLQESISGVLVDHVKVDAIEPDNQRIASLSDNTIEIFLREKWNYKGLVVCKSLAEIAQENHYSGQALSVQALLAGNDLLVIDNNVEQTIKEIKKAFKKGIISEDRINLSVKRVLKEKFKLGLANKQNAVSTLGLNEASTSNELISTLEKVYRRAITVVRAEQIQLPIVEVGNLDASVVSLGTSSSSVFEQSLSRYMNIDREKIQKPLSRVGTKKWVQKLSKKKLVIAGIKGLSWRAEDDFGILPSHLTFLRELAAKTKVIVVVFGPPHVLDMVADFGNIVLAYNDNQWSEKAAAEVIFGAIPGSGKLPVSTRMGFQAGANVPTQKLFRLTYSSAKNAGFDIEGLKKVDELVEEAIRTKATPGGVVLAAKNGNVGFLKSYGRHTYSRNSAKVEVDDVYDLASVTKIAATTLAIMKLHDDGLLSIYDRIDKHLPKAKGTNKAGLIIQDILAHRAKLKPWIPFYKSTLNDKKTKAKFKNGIYALKSSGNYTVPVAERLFINESYKDTIYQKILDSPLRTSSGYRYSDLGFYLLADVVKEITGQSIDAYVNQNFYKPMGLSTTCYNPLNSIDRKRIPPTENDNYFRFREVKGYVHDMGAAMLGGISGHAGLFSNITDLAAIMQMLLNNGYYGGKRYLSEKTIKLFTTRHPLSTRRARGFDMAELGSRKSNNLTPMASSFTFGHLGFTGTCAWADPKTKLVYIFLTNRTYPRMKPNKFGKENYRPRIHEAIYESLLSK